uniref:AlNc14C988G12698 protein n=1 Tax=Albugo laibachii Nc14 TaxID=890382 RepID=F0X2E1_9STRA|nr:AlNc14C988G12698 [Albugo laibachii Nc14]|eukprot:CCA28028.1 AlNc14C988G12698 [Albugo laibachii Nc14]
MLKREIMCLVALEYCKAKADEVALYNLILERAREQQDYFLTTIEDKQKQTTQSKAPISRKSHTQYVKGSMNGDSRARPSKQHPPKPATSTPPRDGFLECKGPHWVSECPKSSNAQKDEAKRAMRESMAARSSAKRSTLSSSQESQLSAVLAGPVNITCVECIVLDEEGDKFSLGKDVLSSLGMDVGAMIAKLADQPPIQMMMILPTISLLKLVSMSIQTS